MKQLTLYKSSAGSGKTFTLVLAYLKLVLPAPLTYRQVLAVTFTNKATEEMKTRIIDTLSLLSSADEAALAKKAEYTRLKEHFEQTGQTALHIPTQARQTLNLILNDYTNFSVSTIESFFQRIVRAFARELNIPLGYDVEMNQRRVLDQLVDQLLLKMGYDRKLTRLMEGFVGARLADEKSWNVDHEIRSLGGEIFKEQFQRQEAAVPFEGDRIAATLELTQEVAHIRKEFETHMEALADRGLQLIQEHGLKLTDFKYKSASVPAYFLKVKRGGYEPGARTAGGYENPDAWYKKGTPAAHKIETALASGLLAAHCDLLDYYEAESQNYHTALAVSKTLYSFGLLSELEDLLENYRRAHSQMLISDTGGLLKKVMGENADTPFIYEKVGTRFKHYLLDEFQDTSDLQWENLLPLVQDALAQGAGSLIVGDAKQSIYRWRNGNMLLLMYLVEQQILLKTQQEVDIRDLGKNYRTAAEIVHFNNTLFEQAAEQLAGQFPEIGAKIFRDAYARVAQEPQKDEYPGYVEVEFLKDDRKEGGENWREKALEQTYRTLHQLRGEGFRGEEITLLVRANKDGVELATYLQQRDIKVLSAESLLLISHPGVRLLTALLQYLNHENDPIAQAALAYHYALLDHEGGSDHETFSQREIDRYAPQLAARKAHLQQLPVYQCVEELIRLLPPSLAEPNAYVQGFMDAVLQYSVKEDASIAGFLASWEEEKHKRAIAAAPDPDAVQIMTIHKAKGLEFPIVILPFTDWDLRPSHRGLIWVQPTQAPYDRFPFLPVKPTSALEKTHFAPGYQREVLDSHLDSLNMLYVAFTRPKYRLYAFAPVSKKPEKLASVADLLHQLPAVGGSPGMKGGEERTFREGEAVSKATLLQMQGKKGDAPAESAIPLIANVTPRGDWQRAIRVKYQAGQFLDTEARTGRIDRGKLIHEALAHIETAADLPDALARLRVRGLMTEADAPEVARLLKQALEFGPVQQWFEGSWQVKNEADILTHSGQLLRPDRVMLRAKEAVVVDYKTGQPARSHLRQVESYVEALQRMGYEARGFVYYLVPPEVVAVGEG